MSNQLAQNRIARFHWPASVLLALIWPIIGGLRDLLDYPRSRVSAGFLIFCAYAGWTFTPLRGSDAYSFAAQIDVARQGLPTIIGEQIPSFLVHIVASSGLAECWYFILMAILYGLIVSAVLRLLLRGVPAGAPLGHAAWFFYLAFILNYPVFASVAARYHLGLWEMMLATLLALEERWWLAFLAGAVGFLIHFGFSIFLAAMLMHFATRRLGKWQIVVAYVLLAISFALPSDLISVVGKELSSLLGGNFGNKITSSVNYAQKTEFGAQMGGGDESWFLKWYTQFILYALLLSAQILWTKIRWNPKDRHYAIWSLVLFMWVMKNIVGGDPEAAGRVGRNMTALLLLFHASWFLEKRPGAARSVIITAVPILYYYVVYYRIWLDQASITSLLPLPWGVFRDDLPRAMQPFFGG